MTLIVLMSGLVAISGEINALTPQEGHVSYSVFYHNSGNSQSVLAGNSVTVNVYTLSGIPVTSYSGNHNNVTLPYGKYLFKINPAETVGFGNTIITNQTQMVVSVNSPYQSATINISYYNTVKVNVNLAAFTTGSATSSFSTVQGFNFQNVSTSNGTFTVRVPVGTFLVTTSYGGIQYNFFEKASSASTQISLDLSGTNYYGFVYTPGGSNVNNFNVILINGTAGSSPSVSSYQVVPFSSGFFQLTSNYTAADTHMVITAKGYAPMNVNPSKNGMSYTLQNASSNITYNYNLSDNPNYLNLSVNYAIGNSTALPFLPNSTIGSLYWQKAADGFTSSSPSIYQNIGNLSNNYTNETFLVDGYNYNLSKVTSPTVTVGPDSMTASVSYSYTGSGLTASYLAKNGLTINLDAIGTQYLPGSLNYRYNISYNSSLGALSSPASAVSHFISPVVVKPQQYTGFLKLSFKSVSKPYVTASSITEYWANQISDSYLLNRSASNTLFVAPVGKVVSLNLSNGYYNPVTGSDDYQDSLHYSWATNASSLTNGNSYNASMTFNHSGPYYVNVSFESSSGATNYTNFTVFATKGAVTPAVNVSYSGKALLNVTSAVNKTYHYYAPLLKSVSFSSSGSMSSVTFKGITYNNISVITTWGFPGYQNTGQSVSYTYSVFNYSNPAPEMGYMNVTSVTGQSSVNVTLAATINDTVAPTPVMTLYNSTGTKEVNPLAGQWTTFSANKSTDNYYPESKLTYNWSILYKNGTVAKPGKNTYQVLGNKSFNDTSYIQVKFETLNNMIVSLSATNPSNLTGYDNSTVTMLYSTPRIVVDSIYVPKTLSQGSTSTINVTVSNNGSVSANNYTISLYINGNFVTSHDYTTVLAPGASANLSFSFKSPVSGTPQFQFRPYNTSEPSFFATYNSYTTNLTVKAPSYVAEIVAGIVVVIIILIGVAYSRFGSSSQKKAKAISRKDDTKKKLEEPKKKQLEDKDSSNNNKKK